MDDDVSIDELREAVEHMHEADATYVEPVDVHEKVPEGDPRAGQTVWDGTVQVFNLTGHPR